MLKEDEEDYAAACNDNKLNASSASDAIKDVGGGGHRKNDVVVCGDAVGSSESAGN